MGTSGSKSFDVEMDTLAEETKFPYGGDPFEGLSERAKKIFQGCQDLNLQTIEGLEEKAKKLLLTCHDLNLQRFEGLVCNRPAPNWSALRESETKFLI